MIDIDIIRYNLSYLHPKDGRQEIYGEDYDLCEFITNNLTDDIITLELVNLSDLKKSELRKKFDFYVSAFSGYPYSYRCIHFASTV